MQRPATPKERTAERTAERMVACAYCALNQPVSESILAKDGEYYCGLEHQQRAAEQGAAPHE